MDRVERNHEHQKRSDGGAMAQPDADDDLDVPPAPEEVIADERFQYQAMTELDDEEYARLADDIRENGVLQPVIVDDSPEQVIIDGHHREAIAQHYDLPKEKEPAYVVVGGADDDEKLSRAIKQNLIGRDTTEGVKSHAVRQYIELSWDRTDDGDLIRPETDSDVAEKLGVSRQLVSKVVSNANGGIIYSERIDVREIREENPDLSFSEVAEKVDASRPTVTKWIKEDFGEGDDEDDDDQPTLTATATDRTEAEKTADVFRRSQGDEDDDVREEAEENAERLARGDTSPDAASKNVEIAEAEKEVEAQKESEPADDDGPTVREADATDLLADVQSADALVADPPYTTDVDDIESFVQSWVPAAIETIGDDGVAFITVGAYADELQTYLNALDELGVRDRTQVLVWTYKNTIGRAPSTEYKRNWQAILFVQSEPAVELDAPLTSERWGVQDINAPDGRHDGRHHKWEKPAELIDRFIRHTTEEGDTVVDPFVGTGTTALVAHDLGRDVVAGDNSAEMLDIAVERGCVLDE
ncbi:MAG: DNA methyltransferase [Haloquadratum phage sp.]|nr:MAG: DNA methyltransferase [Haloquadratum phage sp.]